MKGCVWLSCFLLTKEELHLFPTRDHVLDSAHKDKQGLFVLTEYSTLYIYTTPSEAYTNNAFQDWPQ